jgi:hypothetical protein
MHLSGLEMLRRMVDAALPAPPFSRTMTVWIAEAEECLVVFHGDLRCEGVATHVSRRMAGAEGKLYDARGRLVALGVESCMVMDIPSRAT